MKRKRIAALAMAFLLLFHDSAAVFAAEGESLLSGSAEKVSEEQTDSGINIQTEENEKVSEETEHMDSEKEEPEAPSDPDGDQTETAPAEQSPSDVMPEILPDLPAEEAEEEIVYADEGTEPVQVYAVRNGERTFPPEYLSSFTEAGDYIMNASEEETEAGQPDGYIIELTGDVTLDASEAEILSELPDCEVRLNQHILTVPNHTSIRTDMYDGTIQVAQNGLLTILSSGDTVFQEIVFQFDASSTTGGLTLGAPDDGGSIHLRQATVSRIVNMKVYGDVACDADLAISGDLYIQNGMKADGTEGKAVFGGSITAKTLSYLEGKADVNQLTVSGASTAEAGSCLSVRGSLSLGNTTISASEDPEEGLRIDQVQLLDGNQSDEVISTGTLRFTGSLTRENAEMKYAVYIGRKQIRQYETEEEIQEEDVGQGVFVVGETLAEVTGQESSIPTSYFGIPAAGQTEQCVVREGNALKASGIVVDVSYDNEESDLHLRKQYSSVDLALSRLAADFGSQRGEYVFTFRSDAKMTKSITLPSFVERLYLQSEEAGHWDEDHFVPEGYRQVRLDLNGFTITTPARVELGGALGLCSTAEANGTLALTAAASVTDPVFETNMAPDENGVVDLLGNQIDPEDRNRVLLDRVNLTSANGWVQFSSTETEVYEAVSAITVKRMTIENGNWKFQNVTLNNARLQVTEQASAQLANLTVKSAYTGEASGMYSVENSGILEIDTLAMSAGTFRNSGEATIAAAKNIYHLENTAGSRFICDTFVQNSKAKTYFEPGSEMTVNKSAVIYGAVIGGRDGLPGEAYFFQKKDTVTAFEGTVTRTAATAKLAYGILPEEGSPEIGTGGGEFQVAKIDPRTTLFTTKIKNFPTEYIRVNQPEEKDGEENKNSSRYEHVYQQGQEIRVGGQWITVKTRGANGTERELESFIRWTDAQNYLNTLSNTSMTYVVELSEDVITEENLTLPAKVGELIFRGAGKPEERILFSYVGNLSLASDTTFENIELQAIKYNTSKKVYEPYRSVVTLNGKDLVFNNVSAEFDTVTGKAASVWTISDSNVSTARGISTLGQMAVRASGVRAGTTLSWKSAALSGIRDLTMERSELTAKGTVAVSGTLSMEHAVLDTDSKINVGNIISNSMDNEIRYGGNTSANILTITGTVSTRKLPGEMPVIREGGDSEAEARIQKAAINITVHLLADSEAGYPANAVLLNAAKAASSWFVVGGCVKETDGIVLRSCEHTTHKEGNVIKCDGIREAVVLKVYDGAAAGYVTSGGFATLQEAFSEIDRLADKKARYLILIQEDTKDTVTKSGSGLTLPARAEEVTVEGAGEGKTIYYKGTLTLKSNVCLRRIQLSPESSGSTFALGNFVLELAECTVAEGRKITAVSGSGVNGTSGLTVKDSDVTIQGAVKNIGNLYLNGAALYAQGAVNIGNLYAANGNEQLVGAASVVRENGRITAVKTQMTINGQLYADLGVGIGLQEKTADGWQMIDFQAEESQSICMSGIRLAKAVKISSMHVLASMENVEDSSGGIVKSASYLTYTTKVTGVGLHYTDSEGKQAETDVVSFADAVAEINSLKTKRDYTVLMKEAVSKESRMAPKELTMPSKSWISSLEIRSGTAGTPVNLYYTGNLTMTSDVRLSDVNFIQMTKSGSVYVPVNEQKKDYPGIVSLASGGYALDIAGTVTFNTPLSLTGSSKGMLTIAEEGQLWTVTNHRGMPSDPSENLIVGKITGFGTVKVGRGQSLIIQEYGTWSENVVKYTGAGLSAATLDSRGEVIIEGTGGNGSVSVTNTILSGGSLTVAGKAVLTNATLAGSTFISVEKEFQINGILSSTTPEAYLYTRQKGSGKAPWLNIAGTVVLQDADKDRIHVGVYDPYSSAQGRITMPRLKDAPGASAQLLTAKTAPAEMFVPCSENVGGVGAYDAENPHGYLLKKSGSSLYVYYAEEILVALCRGDRPDGDLRNTDVINYYTSFQEAVTAVDSLRDSSAVYTLMLLQDVGNDTPVTLNLPVYASRVVVTGRQIIPEDPGENPAEQNTDAVQRKLYYVNDITLKCDTVFRNIELNPMSAKKAGIVRGFRTGVFDLTLQDIQVGDKANMALGSITGNAKQITTLNSTDLVFSGDITGSQKLILSEDVSVKGKLNVSDVELTGGVTLTAFGTVSVANVINNGNGGESQVNRIVYGRSVKNITNLSISGTITGSSPEKLILNMSVPDRGAEDFRLVLNMTAAQKTVLSEGRKLANMARLFTSDFDFQINGIDFGDVYETVKAGKALYLVSRKDGGPESGRIELSCERTEGERAVTRCLDLAQAVGEINTLSDKGRDYTITLGDVVDTNLTDKNRFSAMTMPGNNKAASVTLQGAEGMAELTFSGSLTAYGNLGIQDICFDPVKSVSSASPADFHITVSKSGAGASLCLERVTTKVNQFWSNGAESEAAGFIGKIVGTKNVTDVIVKDSTLRLKTGLNNVNDLTLDGAHLTTCGSSVINDLTLQGASSWDASGTASVQNVDASGLKDGYLAARQAVKTLVPQFTVRGMVTNPILWQVIRAGSAGYALEYVEDYKDVSLAIAPKESADKFVAYPYGHTGDIPGTLVIGGDDLPETDWIAYKDRNNHVRNGSRADMAVQITREGGGKSWAKSFEEAVAVINNMADTSAHYVIQFLDDSGSPDDPAIVRSGANDNFGNLTLPAKAASVTVRGLKSEGGVRTVLEYTGTLIPRCNLVFEDILLTEGSYNTKTKTFTPSYMITPAVGANSYRLEFRGQAGTLKNPDETDEDCSRADLVWNYVKGTKGSILVDGKNIYVKKYIAIPELYLEGTSTLCADSYITVTSTSMTDSSRMLSTAGNITLNHLYIRQDGSSEEAQSREAWIGTPKVMKLGNIQGDGKVILDTSFTAVSKKGQISATQLTISGKISGVQVGILPKLYDLDEKTWHAMTEEDAERLDVSGGKIPAAGQKTAALQKASTENISILCGLGDDTYGKLEGYTLYKYEGGLYVTSQPAAVHLIGYAEKGGPAVYEAEFLDWAQAVREIDRIADPSIYYEMILEQDLGGTNAPEGPLGTLSMPSKAAEVSVRSANTADGTGYNIFFTGTTVTLKCNTSFENVGLMAVKKVVSAGNTRYDSVTYNMNAGNYCLQQSEMNGRTVRDNRLYTSIPGNISGTAKGSYLFFSGFGDDMLWSPAVKLSGFGTAEFQSVSAEQAIHIQNGISGITSLVTGKDTKVVSQGDVSVKNLEIGYGSCLQAKNVTSTGVMTMAGGTVKAGTDKVGDGSCKLNQIIIREGDNVLEAKQDKNGNSMLVVNGTVEPEAAEIGESAPGVLFVGIHYNNNESRYAQLHNGMVLLTAPKAEASWFHPLYTEENMPGMGVQQDGYHIYKSGKTVKYGTSEHMEVCLHRTRSGDSGKLEISSTLFATFEEAVSEINTLNLYKPGTKVYEDYEIELLKSVEIGNTSGNGAYSGLTLPTRAGNVKIFSRVPNTDIRFSGNVTVRCNTVFENVGLHAMKRVSGKGVPTTANYVLGNYTLTLDQADAGIGTVSGSSASGCLRIRNSSQGAESYEITVTGINGLKEVSLGSCTKLSAEKNCSIYQICFETEEDRKAVLAVNGTLTTTLIRQDGVGEAVIQKPLASTFTIKGADLDLDGDGIKEKESVIHALDSQKLRVQLMAETCPTGTKILTCRYLDLQDYMLLDQDCMEYTVYQNGTSLMLGNRILDQKIQLGNRSLHYALSAEDFIYSGKEIRPAVVLTDEGYVLQEGIDYQIAFTDNLNAGTARIQIQGADGTIYDGSAQISFLIQKKNLASNGMSVEFTGRFITAELDGEGTSLVPEIQVEDGGREPAEQALKENQEYMLSYWEDGSGCTCATVSGIGNYKGSVLLRFGEEARTGTVQIISCRAEEYHKEDQTLVLYATASAGALEKYGNLSIVEMDNTGSKVIQFPRDQKITESGGISATFTSSDGFRSDMMNRYGLVTITKSGYRVVSSNVRYIENPEIVAALTNTYWGYYDSPDNITSKKGMQGVHAFATEQLRIQNTLENMPLNELILTSQNLRRYNRASYVPYTYKGKTYYFLDMVAYLNKVYQLSGWGKDNMYGGIPRNVTYNLLLSYDPELAYLIHPSARDGGGHTYYTLNMQEKRARETFEALFCYLGDKFGGELAPGGSPDKKYRVSNWVIGNEVNCCQVWNYSGGLSLSDCVKNYAEAFQLLYQGVKRGYSNTKVFISLDHDWNARENGHGGKEFLDEFARYMHETAPGMNWNVDYHPYSQPLPRNDFWNDYSNTTDSESTAFISMRNLNVLTNYLGKLEKKYGMDQKDETGRGYIRVMLGEQGFTTGNGESQQRQAAAVGYGFYLAMENKRVDSYIIRSYNDDPAEGIMQMGVMDRYDNKKISYNVYRDIDRGKQNSLNAMNPYRGIAGVGSWESRFSDVLREIQDRYDNYGW